MAPCAVILFLCVLADFHKGLAAVIETQQTVMAAVGEEALLHCQLMQPKDVILVTWQKVLPEGEKNLASFSQHFGQKVNPDFRDKVEFKYAGLQSSSIVIRRVTEEDEGCYHCVFNSYPDGALTGSTCLQLYGLAAVIETQQTVMAAVGEEALLNCQLMQPKDVLQVTWQKILPEGVKSLSSYHKNYGQKVNPDFRDKMKFKYAGLQNSSIVIRRVTEEDEGCYYCLFNTYPDGAFTGSTCLQLYDVTWITVVVVVMVVVSCVYVAAAVINLLLIRKYRDRDGIFVVMQDIEQVRRLTPPERNQTRDQPTSPSPANVL